MAQDCPDCQERLAELETAVLSTADLATASVAFLDSVVKTVNEATGSLREGLNAMAEGLAPVAEEIRKRRLDRLARDLDEEG